METGTKRWCVAVAIAVVLGGAGCGGAEKDAPPVLGDGSIRSVTLLTQGDDFESTIDAAMSPDGKEVFFTANSRQGPGVFRLPAAGGRAVPLSVGPPFRAPTGVATDGVRIYVADPEFAAGGGAGAILSLPVGGGAPVPVPGTESTAPRGLEVVPEGGTETVYFTGRAPSGAPGVFKIPAAGAAAPTALTEGGGALAAPDAVTVTKRGEVYVSDRGRAGAGGSVLRVASGSTSKLADIRAPVLAGVALTLDESLLLVSALSEDGTDQVVLVDLDSEARGVFSRTIGENRNGGGIHRARHANVFAWADVQRPGRVYRVDP